MTIGQMMPNRFRQIPFSECQRGLARVAAAVWMEPDELAKRLGISFEFFNDDDFGPEQAALLEEISTKKQFGLLFHANQPKGTGTGIVVHERSRTARQDVQEALLLLGLEEKDLNWIDPGIDRP